MHVFIDQKNLKNALALLKSATLENKYQGFLGGVNIFAENGLATMTTYDLETSVTVEMVTEVVDPGTAFLPLKTLQAIVNTCKNQVEMRQVENGVYRVCNAEIRDIASPAPVPYHASEYDKAFSMRALDLASALKKSAWAMSEDATRHTLQTTLIESDGVYTIAVACNNHVLAAIALSGMEPHAPFGLSMPKNMVAIITKYFAKEECLMHISQDNERVTARGMLGAARVTISSRRVQGGFPDWKRLVPSQSVYRVEMDRVELLDMLKSLKSVARAKTACGKFDFSDGKTASVVYYDDDQNEYKYSCHVFDGSFPYKVGFNVTYLHNVTASLSGNKVALLFGKDEENSVVIKNVADLFVVMPMRA